LDKAVGKSTITPPERKETKEVTKTTQITSKSRIIYESLKHGKIEQELKV
jgi:hypothetical protein